MTYGWRHWKYFSGVDVATRVTLVRDHYALPALFSRMGQLRQNKNDDEAVVTQVVRSDSQD